MAASERAPVEVTITRRALWQLRLLREAPRYLLCALALAGVAASIRFTIAPPHSDVVASDARAAVPPDAAAAAYAALFTRRYLTWDGAEPQASVRSLESFLGPGMEADAGLELPASGEQRAEWVEVVQAREPAPGEHIYTVAAQTDSAGLLYLTVPVTRTAAGTLALAGYPAFVGAPAAGPAQPPAHLREVEDPALATVVQRVLRNYLAASAGELEADLSSGARVSLPGLPLSLESMQHLYWAPGSGAVLATVQAQDRRGVQYVLAYELDVVQEQGRWEVSAVQTNPNT
jgi:Conjugative transposon protein TcpC